MKLINSIIILIFIGFTNLFSQVQIIDSKDNYVSIGIDSLFSNFVNPEINSKLMNDYFDQLSSYQFIIFIVVDVDTNNKIKKISRTPIYGYGNSFSDSSKIWESILTSIDSVSQYWRFKPVHHLIKNDYSNELKIYYKKVNEGNNSIYRPNNGKQQHCFVINLFYRNPLMSSNLPHEPMFLYWLNIESKNE